MSQQDILETLTAFQIDVLATINAHDGDPYGLEIKAALSERREGTITNGRLYTNLPELADRGFLDVYPIDKRTNGYAITDEGVTALRAINQRIERGFSNE